MNNVLPTLLASIRAFFSTQNKFHIFNSDAVFQATLVSTCCEHLRQHRSFIPSAHAPLAATAGGVRGVPGICVAPRGAGTGTLAPTSCPCAAPARQGEMRWEGTRSSALPGSITPCRDPTPSSPPPPEQGRIRPCGSCQRRFPLPPPPAQLQHGAVGGGNEAAKGIKRGTEPSHK